MEPSILNDEMTKVWKAGVYGKPWVKKNRNVLLEVDADAMIELIYEKLENDSLNPAQFSELVLGVANILLLQYKHASDFLKQNVEMKEKEKPSKKAAAEPQVLDLDNDLPLGEPDLDFFNEKISHGDQNLMQEDIPLPNIIQAEIDVGFGEMNPDDFNTPELSRFADLVARLDERASSRAMSRPPRDQEVVVATPKSVKKSVTFAEPFLVDEFQVPEIPSEMPAASTEYLEPPATPEVSQKTRLRISSIRPESTASTPVSGIRPESPAVTPVSKTRLDVTQSVQTEQVSPLKRSSMKEQIVSAAEIPDPDSIPEPSPQKELTLSRRSHVHEKGPKPKNLPQKELKPAKRYNKRRYIFSELSSLPSLEDGLSARGEFPDEEGLDYFYTKWNDIGKAAGNIVVADDNDVDERIAEIYPTARGSQCRKEAPRKSLPRDSVVPEIVVTEPPVQAEAEPTETELPTIIEPMAADEPTSEIPTGAEFEQTSSQDGLQPSIMSADEESVAVPGEIQPVAVPGEVQLDDEQPAAVPFEVQPVGELPAEEQPIYFETPDAGQQKIIHHPAKTAELLEKIKDELEGRDAIVFQDVYPVPNGERNLAFYRLLYLVNNRELKCQQDKPKGRITITCTDFDEVSSGF